MKRRLIVAPAWVGDMVMTHTLIQLIQARFPHDAIDVLAPEWSAPLLKRMPEVRELILSPFRHKQLALRARYRLGKALRMRGYVQAYVVPNSLKSLLVPYFAKIPHITGWAREGRGLLMNDARRLDKARYPLMVERLAALAGEAHAALPSPLPLPTLIAHPDRAKKHLSEAGFELSGRVLALCPGAEFGVSKQWPMSHYAALAQHYLDKGWHVLLLGSARDARQTQVIQALTKGRCWDRAGKTDLTEVVDLLALSDQVVSNDSGLMHIAAALARPVLAIYGSTDVGFTPPLGQLAKTVSLNLACSPCFKRECPYLHHHCMRMLSVDTVLTALGE